MNKKSILFILILFFLLCVGFLQINKSFAHPHRQLHFAFISPTGKTNSFWNKYTDYMKDAAKDLNIKLDVYYTCDNPYKAKDVLSSIIKSPQKPDVIMFINHRGLGKDLIKKADAAKLNTFIINTGFSSEERKIVGFPRQKYKHWLGEMYPDDEYAGYILAKTLIVKAKKTQKGTIHIIAIKGPKGIDDASDKRVAGLKKAVKEYNNVVIDQIVAGDWLRDEARQKFLILKTIRYPKATVVWNACDGMALGVIDGTKKIKLKPGKDIITGGIDWIDEAFVSVKKGEMSVSVGGHFMEGAWSIVVLNDYFHGYDFKNEGVSLRTKMFAVTSKNVDSYKNKTAVRHLSVVNFAKFSKQHNPSMRKYKFDLSAL